MSKVCKMPAKPSSQLESISSSGGASSQESSFATTAIAPASSSKVGSSTMTVRADCHEEEGEVETLEQRRKRTRRKSVLQRQPRVVVTESDFSRPVSPFYQPPPPPPPSATMEQPVRRRRRLSRAERNRRTLERLSSPASGKVSSTSTVDTSFAKSASTLYVHRHHHQCNTSTSSVVVPNIVINQPSDHRQELEPPPRFEAPPPPPSTYASPPDYHFRRSPRMRKWDLYFALSKDHYLFIFLALVHFLSRCWCSAPLRVPLVSKWHNHIFYFFHRPAFKIGPNFHFFPFVLKLKEWTF